MYTCVMTWEDIFSFIFPERCIECGREGSAICAICERKITTKAVALSGTTAALFDYHNPLVKKAIWALKYHRKRAIGEYFGNALYREFFKQLLRGQKLSKEEIILIPIPGGKKTVAMRGYNHAAIISNAIAKYGHADGMRISTDSNILYKKREIQQQVKARERKERERNVEDIFAVRHGEILRGKTVIIIDDVITTGATVKEARKAIKAYGPKRVLVLAVAH